MRRLAIAATAGATRWEDDWMRSERPRATPICEFGSPKYECVFESYFEVKHRCFGSLETQFLVSENSPVKS